MLVITRKRNEKVVFPSLGICVTVLRATSNNVRIGIDAPPEVPVHRHEVAQRIRANDVDRETLPFPSSAAQPPQLIHSVRNHLNSAALGLHCLHRMLEKKQLVGAEDTILKVFRELKSIESELDRNDDEMATQPSAATNSQSHPRALLVEDNDNERELLAGYLRLNGVDVETAADGMQAMDLLNHSTPPDFVLIDMRLPRFDGRQTVSAIRENPDLRNVRLFAVSGSDRQEMNVLIGPQGVDRWFSKPLNPQKLIRALHHDMPSEGLST